MYEWSQSIPFQKWLTVKDIYDNHHAFPSERIELIYEGFATRSEAFKQQEKHVYVILAGGVEIELNNETVASLVEAICGQTE